MSYPTVAKISLNKLKNNALAVRKLLNRKTKFYAVVKSNAYGHGIVEISNALYRIVDGFCVSLLSDDFIDFQFPEEIELEYVMRDFLEEEVDEKYYLNSPKAKELIQKLVADGTLPQEGGVSQL